MKTRLTDMTPADVMVLADQAKDQGLGLTPPDTRADLAYLAYCPPQLEEAFAAVFPHLPAIVRRINNYGGRDTYLFEAAAVRAVLAAFGLGAAQVAHHVHRWWGGGTYVRVRKRARPA
jgi:hypothetical protein